jgi:hypothetical protein
MLLTFKVSDVGNDYFAVSIEKLMVFEVAGDENIGTRRYGIS